MSVLAPPPSPTPSTTFDSIMSEADLNLEHNNHRIPMMSKDANTGLKRKASSHQPSSDSENLPNPSSKPSKSANVASQKKAKTAPSLVEFKNGKLVLKQKPLNWAVTMPVMRAIIEFQTFIGSSDALDQVPPAQLHVVAKLVQESDKSLQELAKVVKNSLVPEADLSLNDTDQDSDNAPRSKLSLAAIQQAITNVAERRNYGLDSPALLSASSSSTSDASIPPSLQVWRWEVKDDKMLPHENLEKMLARRKEREEAREQAAAVFANMDESERKSILSKTAKGKAQPAPGKVIETATAQAERSQGDIIIIDDTDDEANRANANKQSRDPVTPSRKSKKADSETLSEPGTPPLPQDPSINSPMNKKASGHKAELSPEKLREKEEKEAAKAERLKAQQARKAEKEAREAERQKAREAKEAERQKAQSLKKKQASFFTSFMQRAQPKASFSSPKAVSSAGSSSQSDFDKTFLPCRYRNLAPINRFHKPPSEVQLGQDHLSQTELLDDFKKSLMKRRSTKPRRKGVHPAITVREIKRIVTESDVLGGNAEEEARKALEALSDRNKVQVKLLQFASDRRPGWYGTWTKSTNLIGPRCPLGQDPVSLDYNYDSDADWEELGQVDGDDLQDADEKEDSAAESDDDDSEMDDWLVDDLEVEDEEEAENAEEADIIEVDAEGRPLGPSASPSINTAKATNVLKPKKKKVKLLGRRFDSKLVPFSTGPHWETVFGEPGIESFKGYQIEFLNDACFGLDPFSFTSIPVEEIDVDNAEENVARDVSTPSKPKGPVPGGVLAALWGTAANDPGMPPSLNGSPTGATPASSKASAFPEAEVPALLKAIEGSTKTRAGLVDDLKEKFEHLGKAVSKNALNERVGHFAAKEAKKPGAAWRVKEEFRAIAGL